MSRTLKWGILPAVCLFATSGWASAAPEVATGHAGIIIRPGGQTDLTATLAGSRLRAIVTTHIIHIGGRPRTIDSNCTYSRVPCSNVDRIGLFVDGRAIEVPRSVFADLADLNRGQFLQGTDHQLELKFSGGDASEAYALTIVFNKSRVLTRTRAVGEFPEYYETTRYVEPPPRPDQ